MEEAVRLEPLPLLAATTESSSTPRANTPPPSRCCGTPTARHRTPATLPDAVLPGVDGNCYSDLGRMEEMLTHYSVAERLAEA